MRTAYNGNWLIDSISPTSYDLRFCKLSSGTNPVVRSSSIIYKLLQADFLRNQGARFFVAEFPAPMSVVCCLYIILACTMAGKSLSFYRR